MKFEFRNNQDFWTGLLFIAIGAAALFIARTYPFGTTLRMGPGYFPSVLGGILILFGIYILLRGLRANEKIEGSWSLRPLILLPLSMVLFGLLMKHAGFVPALVCLVFGSAYAGLEFKFKEILLLSVLLTTLSIGVFIWGLGLPYPLIKGF